jgi:glycosyltransferase involved in cell wall biosynthesis
VPGVTGLLVADATPHAFADAIRAALDRRFDTGAIRAHAERFSRDRFAREFEAIVAETMGDKERRAC